MDVSKNVAEKLDCSLADMRFVKPLDAEFLKKTGCFDIAGLCNACNV